MGHGSPADFGKLSGWHISKQAVCGYWKAEAQYAG